MANSIIGVPFRTRLMRMERGQGYWVLWLETRDYIHGTWLCLFDNGLIERHEMHDGDINVVIVKEADYVTSDSVMESNTKQ